MLDFYQFGQFIISGDLPGWALIIKIILIILSILMAGFIIYLMIFSDYMYLKHFEEFEELQKYRGRRKRVKQRGKLKKKPAQIFTPSDFRETREGKESLSGQAQLKAKKSMKFSIPFRKKAKRELGEWQRIYNRLKSGKDIDYRLALVDADKLLNQKMEELGIEGRNLGAKIERTPAGLITNVNQIRELRGARKLVDQIFLDDGKTLTKEEVVNAIKVYQKIFNSLRK